MYYDYFGFNQPPFRITPDTKLFYPGGNRGAILDALLYAILNGEGIVKVVGEVGSGKTMLCRMLEKELPDNVEVVYLVNPSIAPENTLHAIAFELKLDVNSDTSRFEVMNALQKFLLQRHTENRQVVVFVEEAQSMPIATLEEIRLLSNLETQQSKLLQIVLFGQPELDEMIAQPKIRQLKERITYSFDLTPFKTNDIREYINSRVRACGYRSGDLFDDAAIKQIEQYSEGLVRRINILADKALLATYAENTRQVNASHTKLAARDSEFVITSAWLKPRFLISLGAVVILIIVSSFYIFRPEYEISIPIQDTSPAQLDADNAVSVQEPAQPTIMEENEVGVQEPAQPTIMEENEVGFQEPAQPSIIKESDVRIQEQPQPIIAEESVIEADIFSANNIDVAETLEVVSIADNDQNETPLLDNQTVKNSTQPKPEKADENSDINSESNQMPPISIPKDAVIGMAEGEINDTSMEKSLEDQLLGLSSVYQLQDMGDSRLTVTESAALQQQLLKLPPETADYQQSSLQGDICNRCWSIIYRPVWSSENL